MNTPIGLLYSPVLQIPRKDVFQIPDGDVRAFSAEIRMYSRSVHMTRRESAREKECECDRQVMIRHNNNMCTSFTTTGEKYLRVHFHKHSGVGSSLDLFM